MSELPARCDGSHVHQPDPGRGRVSSQPGSVPRAPGPRVREPTLLRPLGVRAERPREGPAERWAATELAIEQALGHPGLTGQVAYFDGDTRRPIDVLGAITGDVVIHTWDLARAVGAPEQLDADLCAIALDAARATMGASDRSGLFAPPVPTRSDASIEDRLLALRGRDPQWRPPPPT